ncbi:MAG TPA: ATP-binding protein [Flavobacteriales bacterium]|nr:ATP-binding protein [Flavobacteriales bacterium]HRE76152.1 ATP-binding protein [Flavobacteriales bacterium]HRE96775.1 ATP-binding protein [Flavobacteriales bacterium]HRJ35754.1 ATP-binding protein [Flavobacteriales bacterium]HRJ38045.1 ATP-binding protein [Flavobacteriales bacterium]
MEQAYASPVKEIHFPSRIENLTLVEKMIDEVCEQFKVNQDHYGNILIALTEAVNNAILHGNKQDPGKNITLCFENKDQDLLFMVQDEGNGFNFQDLPDPTDPANIEKPNGRGVFLMRNLADEVTFSSDGRRVQLRFKAFAN